MCVCVCVCVCTCAKALPRPFSDQPLPRAPTSRRCVSFCDKEVESDGGNGEIALFQSEGKSEGKAKNTAVARAAAHRVVVTRLPSRIIVCDDCEYIPVGTRAVQGEQKHAHPIPVSTCLLCAVCALFLYVCLNHSLTHCLSLSLSHSLTHSLCLSVSVSPHHSSRPLNLVLPDSRPCTHKHFFGLWPCLGAASRLHCREVFGFDPFQSHFDHHHQQHHQRTHARAQHAPFGGMFGSSLFQGESGASE